jgi:RHH-type proline utilization regulon transcriptional repressor/proline dehydrogenase/delta 1-pyrroline-5-carboxylate dehydrogenase
MFTGSTEVARLIQRQLAERCEPGWTPIPLIAETGGQNAMIVDSSALAEQVVGDVIASAFDSAGQRCSALRVLCLQEDVADRVLTMLKARLQELYRPHRPALRRCWPGDHRRGATQYRSAYRAMRGIGRAVHALNCRKPAPRHLRAADDHRARQLSELEREVFGPVLHVLRYERDRWTRLIDDINATGYGLTFGLHRASTRPSPCDRRGCRPAISTSTAI